MSDQLLSKIRQQSQEYADLKTHQNIQHTLQTTLCVGKPVSSAPSNPTRDELFLAKYTELVVKECAAVAEALSKLYTRKDVGFDAGYHMGTTRAARDIEALFADIAPVALDPYVEYDASLIKDAQRYRFIRNTTSVMLFDNQVWKSSHKLDFAIDDMIRDDECNTKG